MIPVRNLMTVSRSRPYSFKTRRYESYSLEPTANKEWVKHRIDAENARIEEVPLTEIVGIGAQTSDALAETHDTGLLVRLLALYESVSEMAASGTVEGGQDAYARLNKETLDIIKGYGIAFNPPCMEVFIEYLSAIYDLYRLWVARYFGEAILGEKLLLYGGKDLGQVMIDALDEIDVTRTLQKQDGKLVVKEVCDNLFAALALQMQDIIMLGDAGVYEATGGATVGYCQECGAQFIKRHGNDKYCEAHSGGAERLRRHRREKKLKNKAKEAAEDGIQEQAPQQ